MWDECAGGGLEEACGEVVEKRLEDQLPELGVAAEEEEADRRVDRGADPIGGEHHELAGETVGPHAAHGEGDHTAQDRDGEDDAQGGGGVADHQGGEGEGHRGQGVAYRRDGLAGPEEAEVALGQRGEGGREAHRVIVGDAAADCEGGDRVCLDWLAEGRC